MTTTAPLAGRLDIIVNPAGSIELMDVDEWRTAIDVNLTGTMLVMRAAIALMRSAGSGSIVTRRLPR